MSVRFAAITFELRQGREASTVWLLFKSNFAATTFEKFLSFVAKTAPPLLKQAGVREGYIYDKIIDREFF